MSQRQHDPRKQTHNSHRDNRHDQLENIKLEMLKNTVPVAKAWSNLSIALLEKTTELVKKSGKPEDVMAAMGPIFDLWCEVTDLVVELRGINNPTHHGTH